MRRERCGRGPGPGAIGYSVSPPDRDMLNLPRRGRPGLPSECYKQQLSEMREKAASNAETHGTTDRAGQEGGGTGLEWCQVPKVVYKYL